MLSSKNVKPNSKANNKTSVFLKIGRALIRPCFLLYFIITTLPGKAQLSESEYYNRIDNKMFLFSKNHSAAFDSLIRYVNTEFVSDRDRVRAYYTWIALNISYDKDLLDSYQIRTGLNLRHLSSSNTQHPDTVLKYRKAVCEGFSLLMNECCKRSNIVSQMVIGPTKIEDGEVTDKIIHAWNVVRIDSSWKLLDITWSNGYVNQMNEYTKKFSDKYFFTLPAEFVKDHWPLDPMWQLNYYPTSKTAFYTSTENRDPVYFNYRDSIAAYLKLKEDTLEYVSFLHYHWFDPQNATYTREIDRIIHDRLVGYLNLSAVYYDDYQRYANKYNGKVVGEKVVKECIRLLLIPRKYLVQGLNYARGKTFQNEEIRGSFETMVKASGQNLKELDFAIDGHRKFLKSLKGNKK